MRVSLYLSFVIAGIYLSSLQLVLVPCSSRKTFPVLHYGVAYSFWSFVIIEPSPGFQMRPNWPKLHVV